jgi:hypothetical protein
MIFRLIRAYLANGIAERWESSLAIKSKAAV